MRWLIPVVLCLGLGWGHLRQPGPAPGEEYSRPEALAGVELGRRVVEAVHRFEQDTGCWPHDLDELVPDYLAAGDIGAWRYHTFHRDDFSLVYAGRVTGGILRYDHGECRPDGWAVWWGDRETRGGIDRLDVARPRPSPSALAPGEKAARRHDLLRRRAEAMPDRIEHRVGLIKHHLDLGRLGDARAVCVGCVEKWPDYWWSYLMLARIDAGSGDVSDAERRLAGLAGRWDDFFGYAFLAQFYSDRGEAEKCKEALRKALKPAPSRHKDLYEFDRIGRRDSWVDECYYHNAAYLAYRTGDRGLCLAVCDRWREFVRQVQGYGGEEERVLRVVCAANDGRWDEAEALLDTLKRDSGPRSWRDAGIRRLVEAVAARDAGYAYDPKIYRDAGVPLRVGLGYK